MKKKVCILGGGGFIGSHLAKFIFENRDYEVDLVDNFSRGRKSLVSELSDKTNIRVFDLDLLNSKNYEKLEKSYDYVFFLAAVVGVSKANEDPDEVIKINTHLTMGALDWLKKIACKKVVFSSTSENYAGAIQNNYYDVPTDENVPLVIDDIAHPRFSYAVTKILGEAAFINYSRKGYFSSSIVRYHNVYGPDMGFRHVLPNLCERFIKKESPFKIYGHNQTRSFNFIDDAVEGTLLAAEKGLNMDVYHIGDDKEITIEELTKFVGKLFDYEGNYIFEDTFPGSVSRRCPKIDKAKKILSYQPKITWEEGVKITVNWYKEYLNLNQDNKESFYKQYNKK